MTPPFRYPDEDWRAVEACLTKLVPHADACALLRQQLRQHIEATVDAICGGWRTPIRDRLNRSQ